MSAPWTPAARGLSLRAHFGGNKHPSALGTHYFALFKNHPLEGGIEPTAGTGGYGRATAANTAKLWGSPNIGDTQVANAAAVVWPAATGLWSITDPLTHWGIYDAATAGTLWYIGKLSTTIVVAQSGDQPRILAGGLVWTQG